MFTIVISEKGGAERRETFDRNEISVGRVQGNDLMLPKGNVSKHHARLLCRDARFIVTDLRSTNGTYVNGRKISQATIVREGDKIYIGDFVLRVEAGEGNRAAEGSRPGPSPRPEASSAPSSPEASAPSSPAEAPSQPGILAGLAPSMPPAAGGRSGEAPNVSHFPLERDPDSESAPDLGGIAMPAVPGPPRLPQMPESKLRSVVGGAVMDRASGPPRIQPIVPGSPSAKPIAPPAAAIPAARVVPKDGPQQAAKRLALIALVDRVSEAMGVGGAGEQDDVPDAMIEAVERTAREQARGMRAEGEAPEGVDLEALARDAVRELVGTGPFGPFLEDEQATELHLSRPDQVLVIRDGQPAAAETGFTSEQAVVRALVRLARRAGAPPRPDEAMLVRTLGHGVQLVAVGPPLSKSWAVTLKKPRRFETSLEDLVRGAAMSRSMSVFLEACIAARANILVAGPGAALTGPVLSALLNAAPPGERVVIWQDADELAPGHPQGVRLSPSKGTGDASTFGSVARGLGADRMIVASLAGPAIASAVAAVADGAEGLVAAMAAPTVRQALARAAVQLALHVAGTPVDAARDAIGESFDVAIEVGRMAPGGRPRITRIAEIVGSDAKGVAARDLFVASDGAGEAAFVGTGTTPRFAPDFAARGVRLDTALFRRGK